jgi:hypothetical protein
MFKFKNFFKIKRTKDLKDIVSPGNYIGTRPSKEFKTLYHVPVKIGLKDLIKNFFRFFLKKTFPKKYQNYETNIRNSIKKFRIKIFGSNVSILRYLYLCLEHIFIRFKYPHYFRLPYTHLVAIHILNKFSTILKQKNVEFFIVGGVLLGAVRQGGMAGSAGDIDLGIKEYELQKLIDLIPQIKKKGVDMIREWSPNGKCERLQFFFPAKHVDVGVWRKEFINNKEVWIGETEKIYNEKFNGITFPAEDLDKFTPLKLYGKQFLAPSNPENYLEIKYGKKWTTPDKKQFLFEKNKFE